MKTCFSEDKPIKQFGNIPFSKRTPLFLSIFFMAPSLSKLKNTKADTLIFRPGVSLVGRVWAQISD